MTIEVCNHEFFHESMASPSTPNRKRFNVKHPDPTGPQPIPSYTLYTAEEVNALIEDLRREMMKEIEALRSIQGR